LNNVNYQKVLDRTIEQIRREERVPSLLLHVCCAPCSSYVLEYLSEYFEITVNFYNPNISYQEEYIKRQKELERLVQSMPLKNPIHIRIAPYQPKDFYRVVEGREHDREGGEHCFLCYRMRLEEAAQVAKEGGYDYFTTTLSISPMKNAEKLNEIGGILEEEYGVSYLYSDFKKKNGYKRSIELSREYNLYRQDYCGCIFSKNEREIEKQKKQSEMHNFPNPILIKN
jgi:hypothetical protein